MQHTLLKGALPIYARLLADSCGVAVVFGHSQPHTDGTTIYIPDLDPNDEHAKALAYGYIMHEAGHITETSFNRPLPSDRLENSINQILEDVRMESRQIARYPGAKTRLSMMMEALLKSGYLPTSDDNTPPAKILTRWMSRRLRSEVLGQTVLDDLADIDERLVHKAFPSGVVTRLNVLMRKVTACRDTDDVFTLTEAIMLMLREEEEKEDEKQNDPTDPQNTADDSDDAQTDPDAGGDPDDDHDGDPSGGSNPSGDDSDDSQKGAGNGDSPQGDDPGDAQNSASGDDGDDDGDDSAQKLSNLKSMLSGQDAPDAGDLDDVLGKAIGERAVQTRSTAIHMPQAELKRDGFGQPDQMLNRVASETRALRRRLINYMEASTECDYVTSTRGKRLAMNRLIRLETRNARIFSKRIEGQEINTAVKVLLDRSVSMRERIHLAGDAAFAMHAALSQLHGVSSAVAAFPATVQGDSAGVQVLARFGEKLQTCASRFTGMSAEGTTPMAEAMLWSGYELLSRDEDRKILFVVCDGQPNSEESTKKVIQMLEEEGVEIMALGIQHDCSGLIQNSRVIHSIQEMPAAVFSMVQRQLFRLAA